MTLICGSCKKAKETKMFHKNSHSKTGYHAFCKECRKSISDNWYSLNKDKPKSLKEIESIKTKSKKYRDSHRDVCTSRAAVYRASKLNATPKWANKFFIEEAYRLARLRTQMSGIEWQVDHIIPLKGKNVCGLHVEHNLRVITKSENVRKKNKFFPHLLDNFSQI